MIEHLAPDGVMALRALPGLSLQIYRGRATGAHVPAVLAHTNDPILGPRFVQMILLDPSSVKDAPDDEFRKAAARSLHDALPRVIAGAAVVTRKGFVGATARAIMTGLNYVAGSKSKQEVFSSLEEAAAWLAGQSEARVSAATILSELASLQQRLDAQVSSPPLLSSPPSLLPSR